MMAIKILGRHQDQAGTVCQAPLATGHSAADVYRMLQRAGASFQEGVISGPIE